MNIGSKTSARVANRLLHVSALTRDMTEILHDRLGLPDPWASAMAQEIVEGIRQRRGGNHVYVPKADMSVRNQLIQQAYNGRNMEAVCARFGVSRTTVYRACRKRR